MVNEPERDVVDLRVAAPPDVVWKSLRAPELVRHWFGWEYEGLDREIHQIFVDEARTPEPYVLTWTDGTRIVVAEADNGAALRITRPAGTGPGLERAHDEVDEGWTMFAHQLQFSLERHPGTERRTASAMTLDLGHADDPLLTRLGLRPLGDVAAGERYVVDRADGTRFSGEVFFQTDLQLGLSVDEEEDALLVVARTPPPAAPPNGTAMIVLNLYGMDEAQVREVETRWSDWWSSPPA